MKQHKRFQAAVSCHPHVQAPTRLPIAPVASSKKLLLRQGQSILEYTMIVGILTVVLFYMGTGIKRGMQSLVKVTADQVGNQQQADQDFSSPQQGYMVSSNSTSNAIANKQYSELGYVPASGDAAYIANQSVQETTYTTSNTITNAGFIPGF